MSRVLSKLAVLAVVSLVVSLSFTPQIKAQQCPLNAYISYVTVANPSNPCDYTNGGMRLILTRRGCEYGTGYLNAIQMASAAIAEWQRQTRMAWPYQWRPLANVALEIQAHCWRFGYTNMIRPITISFRCGTLF